MMLRRRTRSREGTASVEIVVMLPVMIVLFAAVYHFYSLGRAELTTSQSARACVWQYALNGCRDVGSMCEGSAVARGGDVEQRAPDQGKEPEPEDNRYKNAKAIHKGVFGTLEEIPVVKQVVEFLFGEVASATAATKVQEFRSQEQSRIENKLYLVCNTVSESWGSKIKDSICSMVNVVVGDGVPGC
jgi:hypothetical protein